MKNLFSYKSKQGFTLIELLVVVAIIGLLSSIVFASLGGARAKGRIAAAQGSMRDLITSAVLCLDENQTVQLPTKDTQNGGAGVICKDKQTTPAASTIVTTSYKDLPTGWTYRDGGNATDPKLIAGGDSKTITCDQSGCVTN